MCKKKLLKIFNKKFKFFSEVSSLTLIQSKWWIRLILQKKVEKTKQKIYFWIFFCMNKSQVAIQSTSLEVKINRKKCTYGSYKDSSLFLLLCLAHFQLRAMNLILFSLYKISRLSNYFFFLLFFMIMNLLFTIAGTSVWNHFK